MDVDVEEAHNDSHNYVAGNIREENEKLIKIVEVCIQDGVWDHHELVSCVARMLNEMLDKHDLHPGANVEEFLDLLGIC